MSALHYAAIYALGAFVFAIVFAAQAMAEQAKAAGDEEPHVAIRLFFAFVILALWPLTLLVEALVNRKEGPRS